MFQTNVTEVGKMRAAKARVTDVTVSVGTVKVDLTAAARLGVSMHMAGIDITDVM